MTMENASKARRITIDLTQAAADELEKLRSATGLKISDLFRHALTLLRIYVQAKQKGHDLLIVDPGSGEKTRLEMGIPVKAMAEA